MRQSDQPLLLATLMLLSAPAAAAEDLGDPKEGSTPSISKSARRDHPSPRLKLSYRRFGVRGIDGTGHVPLHGLQLDIYPISRRYFRLGVEGEGGGGDTTINGSTARLWYGMAGLTAGFQYPWRVTPFVEGRLAGGILGGNWSGNVGESGGAEVTVENARAITFVYVGGIDTGIEVYTINRLYLSAAIGWAHPVYTGVDFAALAANPGGGMKFRQIDADVFTFKVGLGI